MNEISHISLSGVSYKIKDEEAYDLITSLMSWRHFDDDPEQGGEYMQVCFYDKNKEGFVFLNNDKDWDVDSLVPIGIVVIPLSHDVYGNGSAGVMSLVNMSCTTPKIGDVNESGIGDPQLLLWGASTSSLTVYNEYPIVGKCNGPVMSTITGTLQGNAYIPSDKWAQGTLCPTDSSTKYYESTDSARGYVPSPYDNSKRNPLYHQTTSPATSKNPLSRFDGDVETHNILNLATAQVNWKTDEQIVNKSDSGYYPAACCCNRFHTEHTNEGDWYLPAEGELGYVVPRYQKIAKTIDRLNEVFGKVATHIEHEHTSMQNYYSSNLNSTTSANRISTMNGTVGGRSTTQTGGARAFTKITPIEVDD